MASDTTPVEPVPDEKAVFRNKEALVEGDAHFVAEGGHAATDQYGHALVEFDLAAERRLLWKIDLYIVPSVALMYLFCFIDRANIGMLTVTDSPLPTSKLMFIPLQEMRGWRGSRRTWA